jgi:CRP-like cAMP-binding protein
MRAPRAITLLDVLPGLGRDLSDAEFGDALASIVLPGTMVEPGPVELAALGDVEHARGPVIGAVVVDGLLTADVRLGDGLSTRLHGPGDVLVCGDGGSDPPGASWSLSAERRSTLALLDDRFRAVQARWPAVAGRLLVEAGEQGRRSLAQQAISQLPRIEQRLLAVLMSVAERWGRLRPDGIAIDVPLSNDLLARMVGARAPTVSLGLRRLRDEDLLRRYGDAWLLAPAVPGAAALAGAASRAGGGWVAEDMNGGLAKARIYELASRFHDATRFDGLAEDALDGAISFLGADFGNLQVYDPEANVLRIAAHRGFDNDFLCHFAEVGMDDGAACGRAAGGAQVVLPDVREDGDFAPHRAIAAAAGFRAVQSTPLLDGSGRLQGVLSTHFRRAHHPQHERLRLLRTYAQLLADALARLGEGGRADAAAPRSEVIRHVA